MAALGHLQVAVMSGLGVTYTVTGGSSLASLARRHGHLGVSKTGWIVAFSAAQVLLSQVGSTNVTLAWFPTRHINDAGSENRFAGGVRHCCLQQRCDCCTLAGVL
jgi:hypothetical protein